jgi:hypothetical protein
MDFIEKANFVHRSIMMFYAITGGIPSFPSAETEQWLAIFTGPPIYPPPDAHPLSRNFKPASQDTTKAK